MRWICLVALLGAVGCNKKNGQNNRGDGGLPDGFISTGCATSAECDDGNPCTTDICGTDLMCTNSPKDCSMVVDDCNSASCDPASGDCAAVPKGDGQDCEDEFGDPGTCMQGACTTAPMCFVSDFLDCDGDGMVSDDTSTSTDVFDTYACATGETGPELAYNYFADNDGEVTVTLDSTADLDLIVLAGENCDATLPCVGQSLTVGSGHETLTFAAQAAVGIYTIIVEGHGGAMGPFTLNVDCSSCKPIKTLDCNTSLPGDTTGSDATNAVSSWSCDFSTPGPEVTYRLSPVAQTDYTIKLTGMSQDLDLLVVAEDAGSCDNTCLNDDSTIQSGNTPETVSFSGMSGNTYDVVIDSKTTGSSYMLEVDCAPSCLGAGTGFSCTTGSDSGRNDDPVKSTNRVDEWKNCDTTTGREVIYHFSPSVTGTYNFDLFGLTDNLDLIVVEGTPTACDPSANTCLAVSNNAGATSEHVGFTATKGHDYYIAVDGVDGAASPYTLRISSTSCDPWSCVPPSNQQLSCTWLQDTRRSDDPTKSKDVVDAWTCDPDATGPEVVYQFKPATSGNYTVTLDGLDANLDLIVLPASGTSATCDPLVSCTANLRPSPTPNPSPSPTPSPAPESVSFSAVAGDTYNIIVDGPDHTAGNYHVALSGDCPAPICKNGNDRLNCTNSTTTSNSNDALGATNDISSWGPSGSACATGATGPELAHQFTANGAGTYTITLSGQQADLDLIVLSLGAGNSCDPGAACLAASQNGSTADETVTFTAAAGAKYWIIVDGHNGATSTYTLTVTSGC